MAQKNFFLCDAMQGRMVGALPAYSCVEEEEKKMKEKNASLRSFAPSADGMQCSAPKSGSQI